MGTRQTSETWTTSSARKRLYKTSRWRRLREAQLSKQPLCECPHHKGKDPSAVATVVDHIRPHRGSPKLFHDPANLQSVTKECHDRYCQSRDKGGPGFDAGCDDTGEPLNAAHCWYN